MDSIKLIAAPMVAARLLDARVSRSRVQLPLHEVCQRAGLVSFFSNRSVLCNVQHNLARHSLTLSSKHQVKKIGTRRHMWTVLATGGRGETTASVSTSDEEIREDLKQSLMRAVSNTNRGKDTTYQQRRTILKLIEVRGLFPHLCDVCKALGNSPWSESNGLQGYKKLEELNPIGDPIDSPLFSGRWALLYTSPIDEKTADKYAGTEEGPFLARVKPAALGSVRQTRSIQVLDPLGGSSQNIAEFKFFGLNGSLNIKGSVVKAATVSEGATRVDVTFESFVLKIGNWTLPSISLSWVKPKGWILTTFLDKDMRVGRGDKGSIFVAVRMKEAD